MQISSFTQNCRQFKRSEIPSANRGAPHASIVPGLTVRVTHTHALAPHWSAAIGKKCRVTREHTREYKNTKCQPPVVSFALPSASALARTRANQSVCVPGKKTNAFFVSPKPIQARRSPESGTLRVTFGLDDTRRTRPCVTKAQKKKIPPPTRALSEPLFVFVVTPGCQIPEIYPGYKNTNNNNINIRRGVTRMFLLATLTRRRRFFFARSHSAFSLKLSHTHTVTHNNNKSSVATPLESHF